LLVRLGKSGHPVRLQLLGERREIEPQYSGACEYRVVSLRIRPDAFPRSPMIAKCIERRGRYCGDGVRRDQGLEVKNVGITGVFRAGTGPERPLNARPAPAQINKRLRFGSGERRRR